LKTERDKEIEEEKKQWSYKENELKLKFKEMG